MLEMENFLHGFKLLKVTKADFTISSTSQGSCSCYSWFPVRQGATKHCLFPHHQHLGASIPLSWFPTPSMLETIQIYYFTLKREFCLNIWNPTTSVQNPNGWNFRVAAWLTTMVQNTNLYWDPCNPCLTDTGMTSVKIWYASSSLVPVLLQIQLTTKTFKEKPLCLRCYNCHGPPYRGGVNTLSTQTLGDDALCLPIVQALLRGNLLNST